MEIETGFGYPELMVWLLLQEIINNQTLTQPFGADHNMLRRKSFHNHAEKTAKGRNDVGSLGFHTCYSFSLVYAKAQIKLFLTLDLCQVQDIAI